MTSHLRSMCSRAMLHASVDTDHRTIFLTSSMRLQVGAAMDTEPASVPPELWAESSAGAWYTVVPVSVTPAATPMDAADRAGAAAVAAAAHAAADLPADAATECGSGAAGASAHSGEAPDLKPRCTEYNVALDWGAVNALCESGIVPLDKVRYHCNHIRKHGLYE
jgi:hypothetical protein